MVRAVLRYVFWGNRPAWSVATGLFLTGLGIGYLVMQHPEYTIGIALGAFYLAGGVVGRAVTGTWRKTPSRTEDWLAPLS